MKWIIVFLLLTSVAYGFQYCKNETTLAINETYTLCNNNNCTNITFYNEVLCNDGCDYKTGACNIPSILRLLIIFLSIIFIIVSIKIMR